jgi:hypothetical protein
VIVNASGVVTKVTGTAAEFVCSKSILTDWPAWTDVGSVVSVVVRGDAIVNVAVMPGALEFET